MSGAEEVRSIDDVVTGDTIEETEVVQEESKGFSISFEWIKAETGPGEIEEYISHPLNFNRSAAVARILRGLTGMMGSLRFAIIDIIMGLLEFKKPKLNVKPMGVRDDQI